MRTSHSSPIHLVRTAAAAVVIGALGLLAVACGDDSETSSDTAAATTVAAGEVAVTGQWARTSPAAATTGAAYVTITSPVDDKLLAAKVDPGVAAKVEVHETMMAGGMGSETTAMGGGEMTMRPVEFIELEAGVPTEMQPGGYHIMLFDLVNPLKVGDTVKLTLVLETAGEIVVDVPVLDEAP